MPRSYKRLGTTGVKVSPIGLGCYNFGWRTEEAEAVRIIHASLEAGINLFDTANYYAGGLSEEIVGKALRGRREQAVVATKVRDAVGDGPNNQGASRYHILQEVDRSLQRLQTDYIDLFQIHRPDPDSPLEETLRTLSLLVRSGKVRYIGLSNFPAWQVAEALWISERLGLEPVISLQPWYCMLHRDPERELMPLARRHGLGVITYGVMAYGLLTGKYRPGEPIPEGSRGAAKQWPVENPLFRKHLERAAALTGLAAEAGIPPAQFAIAWVMAQPGVTAPIIGPRTMEQLAGNLGALDLSLSAELMAQVDQIVPPGSY